MLKDLDTGNHTHPLPPHHACYQCLLSQNQTSNPNLSISEVYKLLSDLNVTLQDAVADTALPTPRGPPYTAFFKDALAAPSIHSILHNISRGAPATVSPSVPVRPGPPAFICATAPGQVRWNGPTTNDNNNVLTDAYTDCITQRSALNSVLGARLIIICPEFFTAIPALPPQPPSRDQCLTVDRSHKTFTSGGESISRFQIYGLLNQMAQLYIFAKYGKVGNNLEVNQCLGLEVGDAMINAQNYVYYVASKFKTRLLHCCPCICCSIPRHSW